MPATMTISQQEFDSILADETKYVSKNIEWSDDVDHSHAREFRVDVQSEAGYSLFIEGRYNSFAGKLSYSFILRGTGRIYGLDLGADHRNPDGEMLRGKHKNSWLEGHRDKWAYVPEDVTEPWDRPVEVWGQFCKEANLQHRGSMYSPVVYARSPL